MTKATTKAKEDRFTFYYGNYINGNGLFILAVEDDDLYDDVTINLYPHYTADADNNEVFIPNTLDPDLYQQFKEQCVEKEIRTVNYGNFDSKATLVRLKPEWQSICKPLMEE